MTGSGPLADGKIIRRDVAASWLNVEQARAEAQMVLTQALAEAKVIRATALEEARVQAEREGAVQAAATMAQLATAHAERLKSLEDDVVSLVGQALRRILADLPPAERIRLSVRKALGEIDTTQPIDLLVAPADHLLARSLVEREAFGSMLQVRCVADNRLHQGMLLLQGPFGVVDVSPLGQIEAICAALREGGGAA
jgi:flagellar biosynthesis/type III secretory pathway protein FliH